MRKQRIPLKHCIDRSFIWWKVTDILSVQQDLSLCLAVKSGDHPQGCCLSTAGRSQERDKFSFFYLKIKIFHRFEIVIIAFFNSF